MEEIERIGDESQKERALYLAGVKRVEVYRVLVEGLRAERDIWGIDGLGNNVIIGKEADTTRRERCALALMKALGDLVDRKEVSGGMEVLVKQEERDAIARLVRGIGREN